MMWHDGGWGGWWVIMPLVWVAFWAVVVWAIVVLVRDRGSTRGRPGGGHTGWWPPGPPGPSQAHSPEEILAERYARGDIDEDEYHRRLDTLRGVKDRSG